MKKRTKIIVTTLSLAAILGLYCSIDVNYEPKYTIVGYVNEETPYATYSKGDVYIVKSLEKADELVVQENDVIIIDQREDDNPNMRVVSSYAIRDKFLQNEIIEIMQEYNKEYPSKWKRTNKSLILEWYVHNLLYNVNYKLDHTTDVDFDNKDEKVYDKPLINSIIKI